MASSQAQKPFAPQQPTRDTWISHPGLWVALAAGLALKILFIATQSITFNADEAILSLMAKHILHGARPVFFYGQSYMGALDAYLRALYFLLFGQTVLAGRLLQITLFLGVVATTYLLSYRLTGERLAASVSAMLVAVPPVLFSLYTTAGIGDYVEILLFNNLLWWLGWDLIDKRRHQFGWWLLCGLIAGIGWWSMSLIAVAVAPLFVIGVWRWRHTLPWARVAALAAGFAIGAAPWWIAILTDPSVLADLAGARVAEVPTHSFGVVGQRLLSLILFNLTALFGLRPPWSVDWIVLPVGIGIALLYILILWQQARRVALRRDDDYRWIGVTSLLGGWVLILAAVVLTRFGNDPTGRYLIPLYPPLAILAADWLAHERRSLSYSISHAATWKPMLLVGLIVAFNLWGNVRSVLRNPPGLTTQFDLISHIPHHHDDDLIAFLDSIGANRGYSNYWVALRLAFLTDEQIVFASRLPYKADLSYTYLDERYPPYAAAVEAANVVVYVTSNLPTLDAVLRERFEAHGVSFREEQIGEYTVFHHLSRRVSPEELDPPWLTDPRSEP